MENKMTLKRMAAKIKLFAKDSPFGNIEWSSEIQEVQITATNLDTVIECFNIPLLAARLAAATGAGKALYINELGEIRIDVLLRNRAEYRHGRRPQKKCWQQQNWRKR